MKNKTFFSNSIIIFVSSVVLLIITALFCFKIFGINSQETVASNYIIIRPKKNENPIDLKEILKENTSNEIVEEMVLEEIDLEYSTEYRNNDSIPKGTIQVVQEGRDGKQEAIIIKKYKNDELISEELVSENLIKASVNRIVEVGTGVGIKKYEPKEGDSVFVTSNLLVVRISPDKESEKRFSGETVGLAAASSSAAKALNAPSDSTMTAARTNAMIFLVLDISILPF